MPNESKETPVLPYDDLYKTYCQVYVLAAAEADPRKIWEVLEAPRERTNAYSFSCAFAMYDAKNGRPPFNPKGFSDSVRLAIMGPPSI